MRGESYAGGGGSGPLVASPSTLFEVRGGENRGVLSLESQRLAGRSVNKRDVSGGVGGGGGCWGRRCGFFFFKRSEDLRRLEIWSAGL